MCLALAVGRGETPLARLTGDAPLVHGKDVVLIGRRDATEPWYGHAALAASPILDIPGAALCDRGVADVAAAALKRLTSPGSSEELRGFWIHLDADVINPDRHGGRGFSRTEWADNQGTGGSFDSARPPSESARH